MKTRQFIVERADLGDGIRPLPRYQVRENIGNGRHHRYEVVSGNICFLLDAMKLVIGLVRKGVNRADIRMVKLTIFMEKGGKNGKS